MRIALGLTKPRQPILGMIFAGQIHAIGENVSSIGVGDRVFGWDLFPAFGCYAEYKCIAETRMLVPIPKNLNFEEAAALPFGGLIAQHFLRKGKLKRGEKILIYGASGAIGTSAIQLASHQGAEVTAVCSAKNHELVKSLGATAVMDYLEEDFTKQELRYDFVFNAIGKARAKLDCKRVLTQSGRYITVDDGRPEVTPADLFALSALAESGNLSPVIDRVYSLDEIVAAHRYVDGGHKKGNVIVRL